MKPTTTPTTIGTATMSADGKIVLDLIAEDEKTKTTGSGRLEYAPGDPHYLEVLAHVGRISPGEVRPVEPWPS